MEEKPIQLNTSTDLKNDLLSKIKSGKVKMRPKAFFVAKISVLIFVAIITFVISVFLLSYTWFSLRTGGHFFLLGFGGRGFFEFFLLLPWVVLLLDVACIFFLDWLLKRFKFGYHNPVLFVFVGSLIVITVAGTVVNMTSFHKNIMHLAENSHLPIPGVAGFYTGLRRTHKENGLFRGEVISIATSSFIMNNDRDDTPGDPASLQIVTPPDFNIDMILSVGDQVFVAGDFMNGVVRAYGIRKLNDGE